MVELSKTLSMRVMEEQHTDDLVASNLGIIRLVLYVLYGVFAADRM